jgi:hypothetical protein
MALKIDLSDLKEDDKVFSIKSGHQLVLERKIGHGFPIVIDSLSCLSFMFNGTETCDDIHPSLFHSIEECIEYFQSVKKDMDEESKPKKRYWLWDVKHGNGTIGKTEIYLDEKGFSTANCLNPYYTNFEPMKIKKHENEFIDV